MLNLLRGEVLGKITPVSEGPHHMCNHKVRT